jgi:hypothetical protein
VINQSEEWAMKKLIGLLCCVVLGASPMAFGQEKAKDAEKKSATATEKSKKEPTEKQKAQQARMKECAAQAGDRKGEERNKFMSRCLKGEDMTAATDKKTAQQDRMRACNKQAGDKKLKGDERKNFMSECLKG